MTGNIEILGTLDINIKVSTTLKYKELKTIVEALRSTDYNTTTTSFIFMLEKACKALEEQLKIDTSE